MVDIPPYMGFPSSCGFKHYTEYEVGVNLVAEALHCILGSIVVGTNRGEVFSGDLKHIKEEYRIIESALKEYSRKLYVGMMTNGSETASKSYESMLDAAENIKYIHRTAEKDYLRHVLPEYKDLALDTLYALKNLSISVDKSLRGFPSSVHNWINSVDFNVSIKRIGKDIKNLESSLRENYFRIGHNKKNSIPWALKDDDIHYPTGTRYEEFHTLNLRAPVKGWVDNDKKAISFMVSSLIGDKDKLRYAQELMRLDYPGYKHYIYESLDFNFNNFLYEDNVLDLSPETNPRDDFHSDFYNDLFHLYEIEYKLSLLNSFPFKGVPKRYSNIKKLYENKALKYITTLSKVIKDVFKEWLDRHAITNVDKWVDIRMNDFKEDTKGASKFQKIIGVFELYAMYKYYDGHYPPDDWFNDESLKDIIYSIGLDNLPSLVNGLAALYEYREGYDDEKPDLAKASLALSQFSMSTIKEIIDDDVFREVYYFIFELWFKYWKSKGILKTRKRIEKAYKDILSLSKLRTYDPKAVSDFNIIINTMHQSGSLLEYIETVTELNKDDLDYLSNLPSNVLNKWKKEMKAIGVEVGGDLGLAKLQRSLL